MSRTGTDTDAGAELRPVDLARAVGVSPQQIRNYEATGVLPPARRTASGYRRLEVRHRSALFTYRALAKGYGLVTARSVMQAVHSADLPLALSYVNAAHAALHEQRLALQATGEALRAVARQPPDSAALPQADLRIGDVAAYLGVRTSALRVWEAAGLLSPKRERGTGYRVFSPADVRDARMIRMLRQGHYPLPQIRPVLDDLRQAGGGDALRAALAQRAASLTAQATAMLEGSGELHRYVTECGAAAGALP